MIDETLLSNLLCKVQDFVSEQNYCKGTWYLYHAAMNYLRRFYERKGRQHYSQDTSWECVLERRCQYEAGEIAYDTFLYVWKVSEMLEECHAKGVITRRRSSNWTAEKTPLPFSEVAADYECYRLKKGCSINTLRSERSEIRHFLVYIKEVGYSELSQIQRQDITAYIISVAPNRTSGMSGCLTRLRAFFRYLIEKGIIHESMLATLQLKTAIHKKIHAGFTMEESDQIIQAVDRNTPVGKRDYAMLLLARYTGLRAVDVIHLRLQDIDWHKNEISIVQHKTQRPLVLPLENIVGNAIAEYILNARPRSDSQYLFLRTRAPYEPLGHGNGTVIVRKYANKAGISLPAGSQKGFHSFRRSIGVNMLSAEVPLATISEVLGHSSSDSTKPYLSIAADSLRMCAMPLTGMECGRKELL